MREDNILVEASLYAFPEYEREIMRYKNKADFLTGLSYNSRSFYNFFKQFNQVDDCLDMADNFSALKNVVATAVNMIDDLGKDLITHMYFERQESSKICEKLELTYGKFRYFRRLYLNKIQDNMKILGMSNAKFIELFDDSPLLIHWAEYVENTRRKIALPLSNPQKVERIIKAIIKAYDTKNQGEDAPMECRVGFTEEKL